MPKPIEILKKYWGFSNFRPLQESIINSVLQQNNTFALLPTGGGKSICYQVPAMALEGVCIVVSPLLALMYDQVKKLKEKDIKAIALTSKLNFKETLIAFDNLKYGNFKFLYLSPEKLQSKIIQQKIQELNVSLIAIDEAHCISEWGHDFRPSYLNLNLLKELHPKATVLALTATATKKVILDIKEQLKIDKWKEFKSSFYRENISYQIIHTENIYAQLISLLKTTSNPVIVYAKTRKLTKEINSFLVKNNFKSSFYHGGLSNNDKELALQKWLNNTTPIMVATNAFGMGIDKENVSMVIHTNVPLSLENYIQECGRAGRNGKYAKAILISNTAEIKSSKELFINSLPNKKHLKKTYLKLIQFLRIATGDTPQESFPFSIQEFCNTYKLPILKTYNAIKQIEKEGIINMEDNYEKKSTLKFTVNHYELHRFMKNNPSDEKIIKVILRSYGGVFDYLTNINESTLASKLNTKRSTIISKLLAYSKLNLIDYNPKNNFTSLSFLVPREDNYIINKITQNSNKSNQHKKDKFNSIINYIQNNNVCRVKQLLNYFNETIKENCQICDVCLNKNNNNKVLKEEINKKIILLLKNKEHNIAELIATLNLPQNTIIKALKTLLENRKIKVTSQNKFKINNNE